MINFFKKLFASIFGTKKKYSVPTDAVKTKPPIVEQPIVVLDEMKMPKDTPITAAAPILKKSSEKKSIKPDKVPSYQMKNNRLHIEYNGKAPRSGHNMSILKTGKNEKLIKIHRAGSMYKGRIDSLRCTKLERAQEIIKGMRAYIERATFMDQYGKQYQL